MLRALCHLSDGLSWLPDRSLWSQPLVLVLLGLKSTAGAAPSVSDSVHEVLEMFWEIARAGTHLRLEISFTCADTQIKIYQHQHLRRGGMVWGAVGC